MFCVNVAVPLLASPKLRKSERGGPFKNLSASLSKSFVSKISKIKVSGMKALVLGAVKLSKSSSVLNKLEKSFKVT